MRMPVDEMLALAHAIGASLVAEAEAKSRAARRVR